MKSISMLLFSLLIVFGCSQNTDKKNGEALMPHNAAAEHNGAASSTAKPVSNSEGVLSSEVLDPDVLIPAVAEKYSGVVVSVVNKKDNSAKKLSAPFGVKTEIEGTPFSIEVTNLFPNFRMEGSNVMNASMDEKNPGARVKIYKGSDEVFKGWLFQNFPGMHGFDNEEYDVVMESTVVKK